MHCSPPWEDVHVGFIHWELHRGIVGVFANVGFTPLGAI